MNRIQSISWIVALFLIALLVSSCSQTTPQTTPIEVTKIVTEKETVIAPATVIAKETVVFEVTPTPAAGAVNQLVIAEGFAPNTFDPIAHSNFPNWYVWQLSYETLAEVQPDGSIEPLLATDWTVSEDKTTYRFELRDGVKFHNGEPFEADDVVYSFERLQEQGIPYAKSRFSKLESVTEVGPMEVEFKLSAPDSAFLNNLADPFVVGGAILNREAADVSDPALSMIGTGPYKMVSYSPGSELVLERFSDYWRPDLLKTDRLVIRYMPEQSSQLAALTAGEVDLIFPSAQIFLALKDNQEIKMIEIPTASTVQINMGSDDPPLDNVDVRRAIALAIDRDPIVQAALLGQGKPTGPFPPSHPWAVPLDQQPYYGRDVERAKELLTNAGYPDGMDLTFTYPTGISDDFEPISTILQTQLADIGINITLEPLEISTWLDKLINANYDLTFTAPPYFSDPSLYIVPRAGRQGPTPPELQELLDKAREATFEELPDIYRDIQLTEADLVYPFTGTVAKNAWVAYHPYLQGVDLDYTMSRRMLYDISVAK